MKGYDKIAYIAVLLLSSSFINAQVSFGIKAGYQSSMGINNFSSVTNGDYALNSVSSELSNGFQAGLFARIMFNRTYFQPELLYDMGSKEYTISFQDAMDRKVQYKKMVTISTLEVPLLVGYKLIDLEAVNLRAFAGPDLRFNSNSKLNFDSLESESSDITIDDLEKDIKAAQLGFIAGVGVDVFMFTLDVRYTLIQDMYQTRIRDLRVDNIPANTFVISLGWKIY